MDGAGFAACCAGAKIDGLAAKAGDVSAAKVDHAGLCDDTPGENTGSESVFESKSESTAASNTESEVSTAATST